MKEFRSNSFALQVFSDNSELYKALRQKLEAFSQKKDLQFLRDVFRVYTRENLSADYLAIKLVGDEVPSLLFEITPYRLIAKEFLKHKPEPAMILSDLACVLLIESILIKENKIKVNKKVLRQLAGEIFQFWKESLLAYSLKEEKIPSKIKGAYDSVIRKFIKSKGNRKIELEFLYEACAGGKSHFLSKEEAIEKFGSEILLYGVSELDPLHLKVLEILSEHIQVSFFISAPRLRLIQNENFDSIKLNELIHEWSILSKFLGDRKLSDVQKVLDFSFLSIPEDSQFEFYESQEAYREVEFVAREIIRLTEIHKDDEDFRLTNIKLILPAEDLSYSLLVSNTFERMGIPHSFTKDIRKKKSPYYFAVVSILRLALSDFDKETVFSLLYNPCFYPSLDEGRIKIQPDIWNQIISRMNLSEFLDKKHKKSQGLRESNLMTWESLWLRLNSILIGNSTEDSVHLEVELLEEVYQFLEVSSSLLQDLIGLKEDFSSLNEFSKFFRIILDTYLDPAMRSNESDELKRWNEKGRDKVELLLAGIENIEQELIPVLGDNIDFSLEDFADILLGQMESWAGGDSRVLKHGVVVGELLDAVDPSFEYVFLVGMDERRFSQKSVKHDSVMIDDDIHSLRRDSALKLKNYFYHILNHKAKKYVFSYVSLDTIKDREYYPSRELENIRGVLKSRGEKVEFQKIPLFSFLEYKMQSSNVFDKVSFDLIDLKKKEASLPLLKNAHPIWANENDSVLSKEIDLLVADKKLNTKIKSYLLRSPIDKGFSAREETINLSVNNFVSYLECPKKFFFDYSVNTTEEISELGEVDAIDALRRHTFIKEVIPQLLLNPKITSEELVPIIFNSKRIEMGEIPFGILGKIAEIKFREYLDLELIPFLQSIFLSENKILKDIYFNSDAVISKKSNLFSTPILFDAPIKANADLLIQEGNSVYVTLITTSKEVAPKKQIASGMIAYLLNQSETIKQELRDVFQIKQMEINPAILHFPINDAPSLLKGKMGFYSDDLLKPFWDSLHQNYFPASPIVNSKICEYCPVNTICHGYQTEFQPFLKNEMEQILEVSKKQFLSNSSDSSVVLETSGKRKGKK